MLMHNIYYEVLSVCRAVCKVRTSKRIVSMVVGEQDGDCNADWVKLPLRPIPSLLLRPILIAPQPRREVAIGERGLRSNSSPYLVGLVQHEKRAR